MGSRAEIKPSQETGNVDFRREWNELREENGKLKHAIQSLREQLEKAVKKKGGGLDYDEPGALSLGRSWYALEREKAEAGTSRHHPHGTGTHTDATTSSPRGYPATARSGTLLPMESEKKGKALVGAARFGRLQEVQYLLDEGAPVFYTDMFERRALHYAAKNGHEEVVLALISAGATIDARDEDGHSPLHLAAKHGRRDVVSTLIEAQATVDAADNGDRTPLHVAAWRGHPLCLKLLLDAGANVNALDENGDTPLHLAAEHNHQQCVSLLINFGADTSIRNNAGQTAKIKTSTFPVREFLASLLRGILLQMLIHYVVTWMYGSSE